MDADGDRTLVSENLLNFYFFKIFGHWMCGLGLSGNKVKSFLRCFVFINKQFFSLRKGLFGDNSGKSFCGALFSQQF